MNSLLIVFRVSVPWEIYLANLALNFSNSFVNPILYALRIPEFREAMLLCCFKRQEATYGEGNCERIDIREAALTPVTRLRTLRTDPSRIQLECKQKVTDTKL